MTDLLHLHVIFFICNKILYINNLEIHFVSFRKVHSGFPQHIKIESILWESKRYWFLRQACRIHHTVSLLFGFFFFLINCTKPHLFINTACKQQGISKAGTQCEVSRKQRQWRRWRRQYWLSLWSEHAAKHVKHSAYSQCHEPATLPPCSPSFPFTALHTVILFSRYYSWKSSGNTAGE